MVTETDTRCEAVLRSRLAAAFPAHRFIGEEESAALGYTPELTEEPTWMVDPVDGEYQIKSFFSSLSACLFSVV